jgi:hypothetical protein
MQGLPETYGRPGQANNWALFRKIFFKICRHRARPTNTFKDVCSNWEIFSEFFPSRVENLAVLISYLLLFQGRLSTLIGLHSGQLPSWPLPWIGPAHKVAVLAKWKAANPTTDGEYCYAEDLMG